MYTMIPGEMGCGSNIFFLDPSENPDPDPKSFQIYTYIFSISFDNTSQKFIVIKHLERNKLRFDFLGGRIRSYFSMVGSGFGQFQTRSATPAEKSTRRRRNERSPHNIS